MSDSKTGQPWTPPRVRTVIIVCVIFIAANIFDAWSTLYVLRHEATEFNPIMGFAIKLGPQWFYAVKILLPVLVSIPLGIYAPRRRGTWQMLVALTLFFTHLAAYSLAFPIGIILHAG